MTRQFWMGVLVGVALVLVWYAYHKSCPVCQQRASKLRESWAQLKNRLGSNLIEPKP